MQFSAPGTERGKADIHGRLPLATAHPSVDLAMPDNM